jgi:shikimate kinase
MSEEIASPEKPGARPFAKRTAVALVGFMGAGKTTVGRALAGELGWHFVDLDDLIEERCGRRIADIFEEDGERAFRKLEHAALGEALQGAQHPLVLALGGGAFIDARNRELLAGAQVPSVFLDAPCEELFRRCRATAPVRPLLGDPNHFRHLYERRRPSYLEALVSVETAGRAIDSVVTEIIATLSLPMNPGAPE